MPELSLQLIYEEDLSNLCMETKMDFKDLIITKRELYFSEKNLSDEKRQEKKNMHKLNTSFQNKYKT
jgi:hypothetical protein